MAKAKAWCLIPHSRDKGTTVEIEMLPLVLCKDCKYYQDNNDGYPNPECRWNHDETPNPDDFCSFGEEK